MGITARRSKPMKPSGEIATRGFAIILCAFWLFSHPTIGQQKYPTCNAAFEEVDYGSGLSIPDALKTLIASYRSDWKELCNSKGRTKPSLAEIFVKAQKI